MRISNIHQSFKEPVIAHGSEGEGQAHNFESVSNYADSHELLAVVAAIHHEGVGETFDDGAVGLTEALDGITAGGVRDVDGGADLDVVTIEMVWSARIPNS